MPTGYTPAMQTPVRKRKAYTSGPVGGRNTSQAVAAAATSAEAMNRRLGSKRSASESTALKMVPATKPTRSALVSSAAAWALTAWVCLTVATTEAEENQTVMAPTWHSRRMASERTLARDGGDGGIDMAPAPGGGRQIIAEMRRAGSGGEPALGSADRRSSRSERDVVVHVVEARRRLGRRLARCRCRRRRARRRCRRARVAAAATALRVPAVVVTATRRTALALAAAQHLHLVDADVG